MTEEATKRRRAGGAVPAIRNALGPLSSTRCLGAFRSTLTARPNPWTLMAFRRSIAVR